MIFYIMVVLCGISFLMTKLHIFSINHMVLHILVSNNLTSNVPYQSQIHNVVSVSVCRVCTLDSIQWWWWWWWIYIGGPYCLS